MSLIRYIRERTYLIHLLLFLAVAGMVAGNMKDTIYYWYHPPIQHMGTIAGKKIDPSTYHTYLEVAQRNIAEKAFQQGLPPATSLASAHEEVWSRLVRRYATVPILKALGIQVSTEELKSMLEGPHMEPWLQKIVADPETGRLDKQQLGKLLTHLQHSVRDNYFLVQIASDHSIGKLQDLWKMMNPSDQKVDILAQKERLHFQYIYILYDQAVPIVKKPTEQEIQAELQKHPAHYQQEEELRTIRFCHFQAQPSFADQEAMEARMEKLKKSFRNSDQPVRFAKRETEQEEKKVVVRYCEDRIPPFLQNCHPGQVVGPVQEGDKYILYRYAGPVPQSWSDTLSSILTSSPVVHKYICITRVLRISPATLQANQRKAAAFAKSASSKKAWDTILQREGYPEEYLTLPYAAVANHIGETDKPTYRYRKMLQWVFKEDRLHQASEPIPVGDDSYAVAMRTEIYPQGIASLTQAKPAIQKRLRRKKQAAKLTQEIAPQLKGTETLLEATGNYESIARAATHQATTLADSDLEHITNPLDRAKAIGTAAGLPVGARAIVDGKEGLIIVERIAPKLEAKATKASQQAQSPADIKSKQQERSQLQDLYYFHLFMEECAAIQDTRWRFFL